jgi:hypothetical protein
MQDGNKLGEVKMKLHAGQRPKRTLQNFRKQDLCEVQILNYKINVLQTKELKV